ncbi:MAG: T9SS type A sorting domain-containing protein [Bacteroidales bacterium]|nr:T9SS type A sorting domain-containing protein [Bacteroidales bacterium]
MECPGAVTDLSAIAGQNGAMNVDLSWNNPTVTVGGSALTDITAVNVYRGVDLITTLNNPQVGAAMNYSDSAMPSAGLYVYKVAAVNSIGEGIPNNYSIYVGEDVPGAVENLVLVNNNGTAELTWVNPTTGAHNGYYLPESITSYTLTRSDGEVLTLDGMGTSYTDQTVTIAGNYSYTVVANNAIGAGSESISNTVTFAPSGTLIFESFETYPPEGWTVVGGNWNSSATNNAGGTAPEVDFNWSPQTNGEQYLITKPLDTTGQPGIHLVFNHMIDYYGVGYDCKIVTSTDMENWLAVHTFDNTQNVGPENFAIKIENEHVGSSTFYIGFQFSGNSYQIDDWFIDDVVVSQGVGIEEENIADNFKLEQNYPNPFNPTTSISFFNSNIGKVELSIFNSNGELVSTLVNGNLEAGNHTIRFDASNLNSGVYFYKMSVDGVSKTKKMVLVK